MAIKRKGRRKRTRITSKGLFIVFIFIGCIIVSGIFFNYLYHSIPATLSPLYEESSATSSNLNQKINKIDHAIYESLYKGKVGGKNIFFSEVQPCITRDYEWDFTELSIKLADKASAIGLKKVIDSELSKFQQDVIITLEDISGREIDFNIYTLGLYTHKIKLVYKDYREKIYKDLPKIAIVIDDIGNDYDIAASFMDIDLPITLSVLPSSPYGKDIAGKARQKGFEVILHLPMEPKKYPDSDPGTDALLTGMDEDKIKAIIAKDLKKVPGVSGVNNHMGSYFTEREDKMTYVLRELKKRDLFFLDSRTTSKTIGFQLAGKMGVPSAQKSVFLDNDLSSNGVKHQIERLLGIARYSGEAVGIGHPHEMTLHILREYSSVLKRDFKVVPVSCLVK